VAPLDEKSRKKLLKTPGPWKGTPEVNSTSPVLHQLESAQMVAADTAKQREATSKLGVKKYENPRHHQANRLKMNDRVARASSMFRYIREAVLEPADVAIGSGGCPIRCGRAQGQRRFRGEPHHRGYSS
jgi:hypothetical protein